MLSTDTVTFLDNPTQELELDLCSVLIYGHLSFMHVLWSADMSDKDYRASVLQVVQLMAKLKIKYLLSDAHQLTLADNNEWMLKVCVPILARTQVKKIARIVPYNPAAITLNQRLLDAKAIKSERRNPAFDFEGFTDMDSAFHWLNISSAGVPVLS
jgi:hypothetical protein